MDWTAIGAVGELLGAAAVVASLLYVGRQVQQNSQALRDEAQRNATESIRAVSLELVRDPALVELGNRALNDLEGLTEVERTRVFFVQYNFLKAGEQVHYLYSQGHLDEDTWSGLRTVIHTYVTQPACRYYWRERSGMFSQRFAALVDELLEEGGQLPALGEVSKSVE